MESNSNLEDELGDSDIITIINTPKPNIELNIDNISRQSIESLFETTNIAINAEHQQFLQLEKKIIEKRYTSFDLLRIEEECTNYHFNQSQLELKYGREIASDIISKLNVSKSSTLSFHKSGYIRRFLDSCFSEWNNRKTGDNLTFPWQTYDEGMRQNCYNFLKNNKSSECRAYFIGYLEVICRVPSPSQSNQGKVTEQSAAWAINRHPYGTYMSAMRFAMSLLVPEIYKETLLPNQLKEILDDFIVCSKDVWSKCWEDCSKDFIEFNEILVESLQHVLFLQCQYLPSILFGFNSGFYNPYNRNGRSDIIEMTTLNDANELYQLCGVSSKFQVNSQSADDFEKLSTEHLCWNSILQNPYIEASNDILVLNYAKTPTEISSVLTSIVESITRISNKIIAIKDPNHVNNQPYNLSADELIPLITFSFALYFRTPITSNQTQSVGYRNPSKIIALLKFAETYLPNHLSIRQEGYVVAICSTAMLTLPL